MNVFDLYAKISLDTNEYDKGLSDSSEKTSSFASKLGNGLKNAAKVGASAIGGAVTAVAGFTTKAVESYASYEQLVGGVETLFGTGGKNLDEYAASVGKTNAEAQAEYNALMASQQTVLDNAKNAYINAGISANTYMEQATAFSASLIQSLGGDTQKAAEYANLAINDMSDNANKMGTDIESIQMTYQSLMRGNYEMLDNLKLGYGGTKSELERLVSKAEELTGKALDPSKFSDVITAIHAVQENMGITGTTAKEAATTIEGSLNTMKGAWSNFLTGLADSDADMTQLTTNLVDSAITVFENIAPKVVTVLGTISGVISEEAPTIVKTLTDMVTQLLPQLVESGVSLLNAVASGIVQSLPTLVPVAMQAVITIGNGLLTMLPTLLQAGLSVIITLANGIATNIPLMIPTIVKVITDMAMMLTNPDNLIQIINAAIAIIMALVQGIATALPQLISQAPVIIKNLFTALIRAIPLLLSAGVQLTGKILEGIVSTYASIFNAGAEIIGKIGEGIANALTSALDWGKDLIDNFITGLKNGWERLKDAAGATAQIIKDILGFSEPKEGPLSNFHTYAPDMIDLFVKGIKDKEGEIRNQLYSTFSLNPVVVGSQQLKATPRQIIVNNNFGEGYKERDGAKIARSINRQLGKKLL